MKKALEKFGGLILFYSVIVFGVFILNIRFSYLNNRNIGSNYINMSAESSN